MDTKQSKLSLLNLKDAKLGSIIYAGPTCGKTTLCDYLRAHGRACADTDEFIPDCVRRAVERYQVMTSQQGVMTMSSFLQLSDDDRAWQVWKTVKVGRFIGTKVCKPTTQLGLAKLRFCAFVDDFVMDEIKTFLRNHAVNNRVLLLPQGQTSVVGLAGKRADWILLTNIYVPEIAYDFMAWREDVLSAYVLRAKKTGRYVPQAEQDWVASWRPPQNDNLVTLRQGEWLFS